MDYLIIGAGPAGLQLGYQMAKAGRNFLMLEGGSSAGAFFQKYPRHRTLISNNKVYTGSSDPEFNMRHDWNSLLCDDEEMRLSRYTHKYFPPADQFVRYLGDFARKYKLPIEYNTRVKMISKVGGDQGEFQVVDERGRTFSAKRLIMATGVSKPYLPNVPGMELVEQYADMSVDPAEFVNKRVLIIGRGNSGFETADALNEATAVTHVAGRGSLKLAWKTHYVGHLRAVNNNFLDTYQLKSMNALLDGEVVKIEKDDQGYLVTFSFVRSNEFKKQLRYDRVLGCTGFRFDASIFSPECRPKLIHNDRFPEQTSEFESTNVPGLYFAGTLMQVRDWKKSTCGFIHGFRYAVRALARTLEAKYEKVQWPHVRLPAQPAPMMEALLSRANRSSGLWQQFAFLGDVLVTSGDGAYYYEEVPLDYVHERAFAKEANYYVITLEYGPDHDKHDPFDVEVHRIAQDDHVRSSEGKYLHPVVRHYGRGKLISTHHITENLENDWTGEETHRQPLKSYFARELGVDFDERSYRADHVKQPTVTGAVMV